MSTDEYKVIIAMLVMILTAMMIYKNSNVKTVRSNSNNDKRWEILYDAGDSVRVIDLDKYKKKLNNGIGNSYSKWRSSEWQIGEIMTASYYADDFHMKMAASGEIFDMYQNTVAHKTLPFNSILRITNPRNGYTVIARVNDRGPFINGRDIDVSFAVAKSLDFINDGICKVSVEVLH